MAAGTPTGNKRSIIVIAVIVVAVTASLAAVLWMGASTPAASAVVHASDGTVRAFPLDEDGTFEIATDKGVNLVQIENGTVRVAEADCPNQDCVNQGAISQVGQQIVCLPHELWVEIVADDAAGSDGAAAFDTIGS